MRKIISRLILAAFVLLLIFNIGMIRAQSETNYMNGINLDIARKFYRPQAIKLLIDQIAENNGEYLQLHLSYDENVAIELEILGQTIENSYLEEGTYYHNQTHRPFLSKEQIAELISYANQRNVLLVPDFDTPGHFTAAAKLLRIYKPDIAGSVLRDNQLVYDLPEGILFAKELYGEIAKLFQGQKAIVIGGDEFGGDYEPSNKDYVEYVNEMSGYLAEKGFVTRIWNDTVLKEDLNYLDKNNLQIIYWSLNGDANDSESDWDVEANEYCVKNRATLPELQKEEYTIINANSYYLYSVPSAFNMFHLESQVKEEVNQTLSHWKPNMWNGTDYPTDQAPVNQSSSQNIEGSLYSIWSEECVKILDEAIIQAYRPAIEKFFERAQ